MEPSPAGRCYNRGGLSGAAAAPANEDQVHRRKSLLLAALCGSALIAFGSSGWAETVPQALASAYRSNPEINSARAQTRAADENVPIARANLRPIISAFASATGTVRRIDPEPFGGVDGETLDGAVGIEIQQNVFRGFRTRNAIRQAEAGVLASRELLRNSVQNVLFDAAQAYMNVIRDIAIVDIRRRNVLFLDEQVRAADERFNVGENTRTDVAQTRARLATARAGAILAGANLETSRAVYRQVVGNDPGRLSGGFPFGRFIPAQMNAAVQVGLNGHPVVLASIHQADAQAFVVKQAEGELLPTVTVGGTLQRQESFDRAADVNSASVTGRVSIPLYQGGVVSARVRQAKENYGLRKIEIDLSRDQVRAAVVSAWAQREAAAGAIAAANQGVEAAEIALNGAQEEQRVGQRTTLDVLNAQQELLNARETLVVAQRDQVVSSFSLLSAIGRLNAEQLNLPADVYDPVEHYTAVKDKWGGLRTPDGR